MLTLIWLFIQTGHFGNNQVCHQLGRHESCGGHRTIVSRRILIRVVLDASRGALKQLLHQQVKNIRKNVNAPDSGFRVWNPDPDPDPGSRIPDLDPDLVLPICRPSGMLPQTAMYIAGVPGGLPAILLQLFCAGIADRDTCSPLVSTKHQLIAKKRQF